MPGKALLLMPSSFLYLRSACYAEPPIAIFLDGRIFTEFQILFLASPISTLLMICLLTLTKASTPINSARIRYGP
jgi:hypothetical protein